VSTAAEGRAVPTHAMPTTGAEARAAGGVLPAPVPATAHASLSGRAA
jgi:hypothetical protein